MKIMVNSTTAFRNIVDWQKWTRYRMMIRGNVLMMFSSEKKTTDTVRVITLYCIEQHTSASRVASGDS